MRERTSAPAFVRVVVRVPPRYAVLEMAGLTWFAEHGHIADDVMTRQYFGAVVLL